jgi:hypothetical protein
MVPTTLAALLIAAALAGCTSVPSGADPQSDAPDPAAAVRGPFTEAPSYQQALQLWRQPEDVNAWIGARFRYDMGRAMQLSETQRQKNGRMPIHAPAEFYSAPAGVCVDLSRFGVETLRAISPQARAGYVMIEFDPVTIGANTLRRHWVATFERDGGHYFFADSKRPGHIAGPYASTQDYIADYARYRGRTIVAFKELETYERKLRTRATRQVRSEAGQPNPQ